MIQLSSIQSAQLTHTVEKYGNRVTAMAVVHSLIDNSEITQPRIKAFLHQRTRQWKYFDLSFIPTQCVELPDDYFSDVSKDTTSEDTKAPSWNEDLSEQGPLPEVTNIVSASEDRPTEVGLDTDDSSEWKCGSVPCPTFAGGKEPTGECIFTDASVQRAILSFFEEVAKDPKNYQNPAFTTFFDIPRPTVDEPFALSADTTMQSSNNTQTTSHMLTPEQLELEETRTKLADMRVALDGCPDDVDVLAKGRARLMAKITKQEAAIKDLQVRSLSTGSLGVGEADEERQEWSPKVDGPRVPFAGTMVDSELLKAAGLGETANEEVEKIEEEEKAFV